MRNSVDGGFTRIEQVLLLGVFGLLAACMMPTAIDSRDRAYELADVANLQRHYEWMQVYKRKHNGSLPVDGGYKFVMATWTSHVFDHTVENFDRFWTPGSTKANDAHYRECLARVQNGEDPWPSLANTTSTDTHYVGRAREFMRTIEQSAREAWMANDNEGGWSLSDGTIHVLFNGGAVRTYSYEMLKEQYGLGDFDINDVIQTWGENSTDRSLPQARQLIVAP